MVSLHGLRFAHSTASRCPCGFACLDVRVLAAYFPAVYPSDRCVSVCVSYYIRSAFLHAHACFPSSRRKRSVLTWDPSFWKLRHHRPMRGFNRIQICTYSRKARRVSAGHSRSNKLRSRYTSSCSAFEGHSAIIRLLVVFLSVPFRLALHQKPISLL